MTWLSIVYVVVLTAVIVFGLVKVVRLFRSILRLAERPTGHRIGLDIDQNGGYVPTQHPARIADQSVYYPKWEWDALPEPDYYPDIRILDNPKPMELGSGEKRIE